MLMRVEQIRKARGHVQRAGFLERLERICAASVEKVDAVIKSLGSSAFVKDVLRGPDVDIAHARNTEFPGIPESARCRVSHIKTHLDPWAKPAGPAKYQQSR